MFLASLGQNTPILDLYVSYRSFYRNAEHVYFG